jgi:DNA (cytosine-5)-methyltransferase 1
MKPRALDLFCCAGGATKGLQQAGFHVTGVDIKAQPRYCGDEFHLADALAFPLEGFHFIWASPPCQAFCPLRKLHPEKEYPNLIPATRARLLSSGAHYCMENVAGAPLGDSGNLIMLCGTMFGLATADGRAELRRHRLFETSFSIALRPACQHGATSLTVTGHTPVDNRNRHSITVTGTGMGPRVSRRRAISVTGSTPQTNTKRNIERETFSTQQAREAMGIDWMPMSRLSQAIPPAYARFIGEQALQVIRP